MNENEYAMMEPTLAHQHTWIQKEPLGIPFRYCPSCERLERQLGFRWQNYPRTQKNHLLNMKAESLGYHRIIQADFDAAHLVPTYPISSRPKCWMCNRIFDHDDLAIKWEEWPECFVNLCQSCYMGKNQAWKTGRWKCRLGWHRWHPILVNPKVCYRCEKTKNDSIPAFRAEIQ